MFFTFYKLNVIVTNQYILVYKMLPYITVTQEGLTHEPEFENI